MHHRIDQSELPYGSGRVTPQRQLIADAIVARNGAFSIEALAADVCTRDSTIGVATVYRAVTTMLASGWLERVGERGGSALFARCTAGSYHHHHVVCDRCGRIAAADCPLGGSTPGPAQSDGFVVTRHEVTLYGLCPECANADRDEA